MVMFRRYRAAAADRQPWRVLSIGSSLQEPLRKSIFTVGVGSLLIGSLAYAFFAKPGNPSGVFAIALILSGGAGNLFDRLCHDGSVVDFIAVGIGPVRTGTFNVADIAITVGAIILFSTTFSRARQRARQPTDDSYGEDHSVSRHRAD